MTDNNRLPDGVLLAYYGDDFTGSTDAMEAMTAAGVPTVLFLRPPTAQALERFPDVRCVGLAGDSRGRDTAWMSQHLPVAFASLADLKPCILQYKVCSTFDSSPEVGSIGHAIELGLAQMPENWTPTIVGVPRLKRYQVFGNLFAAASDGVAHRLDRHPTMSRHPVTPMDEADLRTHLAKQTQRGVALIDMLQLKDGVAIVALHSQRQSTDRPIVLIDVMDDETLLEAGRLVWDQRGQGLFSASSSGLSYGLTAYWRSQGWLPDAHCLPKAEGVAQIAAVSGSCSPISAAQIHWARENGFHTERLAIAPCLNEHTRDAEITRLVGVAAAAIKGGRSALVYSADGPDDPEVQAFDTYAQQAGMSRAQAARTVGTCLAEVMRKLLDQTPIRRIVVAGGDSSGEVTRQLGIDAMTVQAAMTPGAPLCKAYSENPARDGIELILKGGQMGGVDFYGQALGG